MSDEDKQAFVAAMKPMAEECGSDCGLTEEDFKKHNKGEDMDPCFKKCIMQKMGLVSITVKATVCFNISDMFGMLKKKTGKSWAIAKDLDKCLSHKSILYFYIQQYFYKNSSSVC